MILFLDFDGVLHPHPCEADQLFCCNTLLWAILHTCTEVEVIFSSSWREAHPLEELIDFVTFGGGENLAHRFIGTTSSIVQEPGAYIAKRIYKREAECLAWLRDNGKHNQPWLALDDTDFWFEGTTNLYLVNHLTGLTDTDVQAIIERIQTK